MIDSDSQNDPAGVTKQILAYVPGLLVPGLVNFLAVAVYTRILNTDEYGRYMVALALVIIVKTTAFDWLHLGLFRFFQSARQDNRLPVLFSTVITGFAIISLFVSVLWITGLSATPFANGGLKTVIWLGLPLLLVWSLFEQILQINRAALAPLRYGLLSGTRAILCLGIGFCLIRGFDRGETGLMLGVIIGTLLPTLAGLFRWRSQLSLRFIEHRFAAELFRYSLPFVAIFSIDYIPLLSTRFVLQHFHGSSSVGLFSASSDLANNIVIMLFMSLNISVYPLVLRSLENRGKKVAREHLRSYSIALLALTLPACVGLAMVAEPLSSLLLGAAFHEVASRIIPWIAMSTFLLGVKAFYLDLAFQLGLQTKRQIWPVAAAALVNITLNLWWIPAHGLMGAVWATCASCIVASAMSLKLGRRTFPLPLPIRDFLRIAAATLFMAAVLLSAYPSAGSWIDLLAKIALAGSAYAAAIWAMNVHQIRALGLATIAGHLRTALKKSGSSGTSTGPG